MKNLFGRQTNKQTANNGIFLLLEDILPEKNATLEDMHGNSFTPSFRTFYPAPSILYYILNVSNKDFI